MIRKYYAYFALIIVAFLLNSCNEDKKIPQEILDIHAPVKIERFEKAFNNLNIKSLDSLQGEYPFLFPIKYSQEFWIEKSKDTLQQEIIKEITKAYPSLEELSDELKLFYKHIKFYYPKIEVPKIVTLISEVDYQNRIILRKNLLLIALDCYLGKDHYFYEDISVYISNDFIKEQIVVDVANEYVNKIITKPDTRSFLAQMIMYGKRLYLLQQLLPQKNIAQVFSYTNDELLWNKTNESMIWRFFIDKELLYSTDRNLLPRFLYPAPFSKFYMSFDNQSPDRVGQFIGYQIVHSFMQNNNVSLQELAGIKSETIFSKSQYKPKK